MKIRTIPKAFCTQRISADSGQRLKKELFANSKGWKMLTNGVFAQETGTLTGG